MTSRSKFSVTYHSNLHRPGYISRGPRWVPPAIETFQIGLKSPATAAYIYRMFYSRRDGGGTHTPRPTSCGDFPAFGGSSCVTESRAISLAAPRRSYLSPSHTNAGHPASPKPAEIAPICVHRSDQTVWRRLGSRLAGCLSMCSVDEFRAALMRAGGNMCIRDRMRGAKFKLVRTRLHREGSGRALARDHSSFALESEFCKRENELRLLDPYRLRMAKTNRCTGQGQTATASARRYRP